MSTEITITDDSEPFPQEMSIDKIFINLKIISLIKKNEKLSIKEDQEKSLTVDGNTNFLYIQSIKRWINNDNRKKTLNYINNIIQNTFDSMDQIYENFQKKDEDVENVFEEDDESLLLRLSKELIKASDGLKNLRITYKNDSVINSKIQLLLDKIQIKVDKINKLLNVKWLDNN